MTMNPLWHSLSNLPAAALGSNRYLLINQAAWAAQPQLVRALRSFDRHPLLTRDLDACEDGATPFLAQLIDVERQTAALKRLCDGGCFACGLSVLDSALPLDHLARALALRCDVRMSDGQDVLLRYFDTRVLSVLLQVLTSVQIQQLVSCTDRWWYADRRGQLVELTVDQWPKCDCFDGPWCMTAVQESLLLEASEADAMLDLLTRHQLPALLDLPYAQRHDVVQGLLDQARSWGLEDTPDQAAFCALGLQQGSEVFQTAGWGRLLAEVRRGDMAFQGALLQYEASLR